MSTRPFLGLIAGLLLSIALGSATVWLLTSARTPAEVPLASGSADRSQTEKLLGADPDRNIRGGQEMKPRW